LQISTILVSGILAYYYSLDNFIYFNDFIYMSNGKSLYKLYATFLFFLCSILFTRSTKYKKEYFVILNLSLLFSYILISSNDFITMLISIEGLTMSLAVLIATNLTAQGIEASIKYIFVSILGSGFICLSLCLLYSQIGSLSFVDVYWAYHYEHVLKASKLFFPFLVLVLGFTVKLAVFPAYFFIADVSEGASVRVFSFLNVFSKLPIFISLLEMYVIFSPYVSYQFFFYIGIASFFFGAISTLMQKKIARILAFASVNQIGLVFIGFSTESNTCIKLSFLYFFFYCLMLYKFCYILENTILIGAGRRVVYMTDLFYFYNSRHTASVLSTLLDFGGFPPSILFLGKLGIIFFLVFCGYTSYAFVVLFFSLISTFYYLRLIKNLYFYLQTTIVLSKIREDWLFGIIYIFEMLLFYFLV